MTMVITIGHISELPGTLGTVIRAYAHGTALDGRGDDMPSVLVTLVGCPASGKSTASAAITRSHLLGIPCARVCPDDIRKMATGDEADQSANASVWRHALKRIDGLLGMRGVIAVFDATSSHVRDRRRLADMAREHGATVVEVWCDTPLAECYERNDARERHVPNDVIRRMHSSIAANPPTGDGFADAVIAISPR